jgi:hypothetical protein
MKSKKRFESATLEFSNTIISVDLSDIGQSVEEVSTEEIKRKQRTIAHTIGYTEFFGKVNAIIVKDENVELQEISER